MGLPQERRSLRWPGLLRKLKNFVNLAITLGGQGNWELHGRDPAEMKITAEQLQQHSHWVKALAHRLVADAAEADDLVQETWMAAMRTHPPAGALRPWLGGVLRNLNLIGRRTAGRRKARERDAAQPEALPTTAELVERADTQRTLVDAVLALDEPYRTVVMLRYFEDRSSAEIARDRGVPAATVRSQLRDGLARLRTQLDAKFEGDRLAWCVALLPFARAKLLATGGVSSSLFTGLLLMNLLKTLIALVAITATLVILGVPLPFLPGGGAVDIPDVAEPIAATNLLGESESDRAVVSDRVEVKMNGPAVADAAASCTYEVQVRFVDQSGHAIPKVNLEVYAQSDIGRYTATSDNLGLAALKIEIDADTASSADPSTSNDVRITGRASGHRWANEWIRGTMLEGKVLDFGDVKLAAGGSISGRVLLSSGEPAANASVTGHSGTGSTGSARTESDVDGRFQLDGVKAGRMRVFARVDQFCEGQTGLIKVRPGEDTANVIVTAANTVSLEDRFLGLVLDSENQPVPHAMVQMSPLPSSGRESSAARAGGSAKADAKGRFQTAAHTRSPHHALAFDSKDRWRVAYQEQIVPGTRTTFHLREPREMRVIVRDPQNRAMAGVRLFVQHAGKPQHLFNHKAIVLDGATKVPMPSIPFLVSVIAEGCPTRQLGPFDPKTMADEVPLIEATMSAGPSVRGVVRANGKPIAGAIVRLHRLAYQRMEKNGFPVWLDPIPVANATTDSDGLFHVAVQQAFDFHLLVSAKNFALADSGLQTANAIRGAASVDINLQAGGTLEGRVVVASNASPAGKIVAVSRGDGSAQSRRVGSDGLFRFEHLTPGRWFVQEHNKDITAMPIGASTSPGRPHVEVAWNCEIYQGNTTTFDLLLTTQVTANVTGRLRLGNENVDGWRVRVIPVGGGREDARQARLDQHGHFELHGAAVGRNALLFSGRSGKSRLRIDSAIELAPGANLWTFDHDTAAVTITGLPPAGSGQTRSTDQSPVMARWRDGDTVVLIEVSAQAGGLCVIRVPKGKLDLVRAGPQAGRDLKALPALASVDVQGDVTVAMPAASGK